MHRIDTPDAAAGNLFTDGDPAVPTLATYVDAAWANSVQEEIVNVILGSGIVLVKAEQTQLRQAILLMIDAENRNNNANSVAYFMGQF